MGYFAYILKSDYDGSFYYGSGQDVVKRIKQHNRGKSRYTKGKRPWKYHYSEEYPTRAEAMARERFFKTIDGYNYLKEKGII